MAEDAHRDEDQSLDPRKQAILQAVVTEYIDSAQPVGSQHVIGAEGVNVSSATVRAEMAALEREGYLVQPHTSAGRIPTDKGYRFFVDQLGGPGVLVPEQRRQVSDFFNHMHGEMEALLESASGLLTDLTSYASVVVGPSHDTATVRSLQLVGLGPRLVLCVVVLADGRVEKRTLELNEEYSEEELSVVSATLQSALSGRSLSDPPPVPTIGTTRLDDLCRRTFESIGNGSALGDNVFVGGPSRLAVAFDAVETVRAVLSILEQQMIMVSLLNDVLSRGLSVAIGTEHGFEPLASCAVVVAPVSVDGVAAGAVGLLGPTRMNYSKALAAASLVSERLGARLGDPLGQNDRGRSRGNS